MNDLPWKPDSNTVASIPEGWKIIPAPGNFSLFIGPLLYQKTADGDFRYGFQSDQRHANTNDVIHGGMLYSFADQYMGLYLAAASQGYSTTITLKASYLSPGRVGDFIEGEAEISKITRTLGFGQARVFSGTRTLMTAEGVWKLFEGPKTGT
jgi:uncharacterized protein (TIGR00369 family)